MAISVAGVVLLLAAVSAPAQPAAPSAIPWPDAEPGKMMFFRKEPSPTTSAAGSTMTSTGTSTWRSAEPASSKTLYFMKQPSPPPAMPRSPVPASPAHLAAPVPAIEQTSMQQKGLPADARPTPEGMQQYQVPLEEVPGPLRLFGHVESEAAWRIRIRQAARDLPKQEVMTFPEDPVLSKKPYTPRAFAQMREIVEPAYVCHRRLLFEEKNSERYGWELGYLQPMLSAGYFFKDFVLLPYHLATVPCRKYECSAGQCLPGDPVPYLLYPPDLSLTGAAAEAGVILALVAIFP